MSSLTRVHVQRAMRSIARGGLAQPHIYASVGFVRSFPRRRISNLQAPQMMCFQCEQTSAGAGCTSVGVCTKTPSLSGLQDLMVAYAKRLCQLGYLLGKGHPLKLEGGHWIIEGFFATLTNVNFDDSRFEHYISTGAALAAKMEQALGSSVPSSTSDLPTLLPPTRQDLLAASTRTGLLARGAVVGNDDVFGVIEMATYGLKGVCAYFHHAETLGGTAVGAYSVEEREDVFDEIFRIGSYLAQAGVEPVIDGGKALGDALAECLKVGALNLKVLAMLDAAHTKVLGTPAPVEVSTTPRLGRHAILVSGHDLHVLNNLLAQTENKGIDVYTHGEMLPAHGYPNLRKYEHLRGHYGTHWGNQLHEFRHFPGAILMTSNCLRPPTTKYKTRLWTIGPVGFEGIPKIEGDDYSQLIKKALELPQFSDSTTVKGQTITTGFGHAAILGVADKVVKAIQDGDLKHVFVIGGCDGTESTRSYFTDLGRDTPKDSIMLTLGCGKFRLHGEDHGTLAGLPRLLDLGQCNDAYSAVVVAVKLAEALNCKVHDLPLHFAVSWFEQKAIAVLLTLLHLDLKNIRVGPAVPAFLTPKVVQILNEKFGLSGISVGHEDEDLAKMLQGH